MDGKLFPIPVNEQETTINFSRDSKEVSIWTNDRTMMTKLDKMVEKSSHYTLKETGRIQGMVADKEYILDDKSLLSFRSDKVSRVLTEEQKEEAAERMRELARRRNAF